MKRLAYRLSLISVLALLSSTPALASSTHSGWRMDQNAALAFRGDAILRPGYAWDNPFCLRYHSKRPNLLIIGDSIFDGWSGYLLHVFPRAIIDARVGRQFSAGISQYRWLLQYPGVRAIRTVVVELGTNGAVTANQVAAFMRLAGPERRVILVVPEVPRPWESEVQHLYESLPAQYPNIDLVYWNRISARGGKEIAAYYWRGGVHPNWLGIQALVNGLRQVVADE